MADLKISQLTGATTPLAGTEVAPIVQSGTTKQVSIADLTAGRAVSMGSGTVTGDLTVDTSTLKVDSTNNRVGVGTASPGRLLELYAAGSPVLRWNDSSNTWDIRTNGSVGSAMQFDYTGTRFFTLTSGGDFQVNTGNLVIGTSGKGIDFSATPGTGTSELLADYEEGVYTVTLTPSTSGSITLNSGFDIFSYTKVGRLVTVTGRIIVSSVSSPLGRFDINLPFAIGTPGEDSGHFSGHVAVEGAVTAAINEFGSYAVGGQSVLRVALANTTAFQNTSAQEIKAGTSVFVSFSYVAA